MMHYCLLVVKTWFTLLVISQTTACCHTADNLLSTFHTGTQVHGSKRLRHRIVVNKFQPLLGLNWRQRIRNYKGRVRSLSLQLSHHLQWLPKHCQRLDSKEVLSCTPRLSLQWKRDAKSSLPPLSSQKKKKSWGWGYVQMTAPMFTLWFLNANGTLVLVPPEVAHHPFITSLEMQTDV